MTKKQMIQLLDDELDAMNKHRSNIERIKKEYFDSVYGLKNGDKVSVLYKRSKEPLVDFFKTDACMRDGIIRKVKAKIEEYGGLLLADIPDRITPYEIGRDAFESKEEALKHAEERRTHLIESIKKQLNELENLKFECDD